MPIGEDSTSNENIAISNSELLLSHYDYLLFCDSRGLQTATQNIEDGFCYQFAKSYLAQNSFLLISRPKNLTTFATLINFLKEYKDISFEILITNLGLVDFTPKKLSNINDSAMQIESSLGGNFLVKEVEKEFRISSGDSSSLYSIEYGEKITKEIGQIVNNSFTKQFIINTPILSKDYISPRKRPASFYKQLKITNIFLDQLSLAIDNSTIVDFSNIQELYDGIHFNSTGHKEALRKLSESYISSLGTDL